MEIDSDTKLLDVITVQLIEVGKKVIRLIERKIKSGSIVVMEDKYE